MKKHPIEIEIYKARVSDYLDEVKRYEMCAYDFREKAREFIANINLYSNKIKDEVGRYRELPKEIKDL